MDNIKSLMLWRSDFKNKRDWIAVCEVLDIPVNTVEIELKSLVIVAKEIYTNNHDRKIAKELWEEFSEVPMNPETEEIEKPWKHFLSGTHREDILRWFEETFHVSVAEDLMGTVGGKYYVTIWNKCKGNFEENCYCRSGKS